MPADCSSLHTLDWGTGGVPVEVLLVDKFDPSLGMLLEVELTYKAQFVGSGCFDNSSAACQSVQVSMALLTTAVPSSSNSPAVTGIGLLQLADQIGITPLGFTLGSTDGQDDCATPGVTFGPPSLGDCTPGEDHFAFTFDETYSLPVGSLSGADLAAWIGAPGSRVSFETTAAGMQSGGASLGVVSVTGADARVWLEVTYHYCPNATSVGTPYCDCTTTAPCANNGAAGEGCANSTGAGAILWASGSDSISAADLVLRGSQLPPGEPGLYFQADSASGGGAGAIFGDGLRCAEGSVVRLGVVVSSAGGDSATSADLVALGGVSAGDLRRYQLWYRDPVGSPCGSHFNLTGGLELTWLP